MMSALSRVNWMRLFLVVTVLAMETCWLSPWIPLFDPLIGVEARHPLELLDRLLLAVTPDDADPAVDDHRGGATDEVGLPGEILAVRRPRRDQARVVGDAGVIGSAPEGPVVSPRGGDGDRGQCRDGRDDEGEARDRVPARGRPSRDG